jgi:hypothetical protein
MKAMPIHSNQPLLSKKSLVIAPIILFGLCFIANMFLRQIRYKTEFIMNQYWPVSIIYPKLPSIQDGLTIIAIGLLAYALWKSFISNKSIVIQIGIIWSIALATNLLQGIDEGFSSPISPNRAYGFGYWEDAAGINNPLTFVNQYTNIQSNLGYHGRVHPPLSTIIMYAIRQFSTNRIVASLLLSILAMPTIWLTFDLLQRHIPQPDAKFLAICMGILPAFQIFSVASMDAVICTIFLATLWAFDHQKQNINTHLSAVFLAISALMTFGVLWLFPIMLVMSLAKNKWRQFFYVVVEWIGFLIVIKVLTNYSFITGFHIAKQYEFSSLFTWSYAGMLSFTSSRIMDIMEPIIFMGPYIFWLLIQAITQYFTHCKTILKKHPRQYVNELSKLDHKYSLVHIGTISVAAICSFLGFIAFGAYYTGETSRAALYIIPPILLILGPFISSRQTSLSDKKTLFVAAIVQTVLMQLFFSHVY